MPKNYDRDQRMYLNKVIIELREVRRHLQKGFKNLTLDEYHEGYREGSERVGNLVAQARDFYLEDNKIILRAKKHFKEFGEHEKEVIREFLNRKGVSSLIQESCRQVREGELLEGGDFPT